MEKSTKQIAYKKAEKRVKKIRNFYNHLQIFVVMMIVVALFSNTFIAFFEARIANSESLEWIKANIWMNALLWLIGLVVHGLFTFRYKIGFVENWKNKKVEELMNENQ